jgi:hypothetical protein
MRMYHSTIWAVVIAALMCGCQPPPPPPADQTAETNDPASDAIDVGGVDAMSARRAATDATQADPAPAVDQQSPTPPEATRDSRAETVTKADVGAGRKGRGYGGGFVSEPARVYFNIRERAVFQIQIPQALKTYKAMDPRGKGPQDTDEFMEKIIQQNGIQLPELPPGQTYEYDPQAEELMVRRPTN